MNVSIVDPVGNLGGGGRFLRCLVPALKERRPSLHLRILAPRAVFIRDEWKSIADAYALELVELVSTRLTQEGIPGFPSTAAAVRHCQGCYHSKLRWLPRRISGNVQGEIRQKTAGSDLAFFPWPFLFSLPVFKGPVVSVFHDFNFKYFFGGFSAFFPWQRELSERETPRWLAGSHPVVTSDFMAGELARFYPDHQKKATVIRVPPMIPPRVADKRPLPDTILRYGLEKPYVLYPCNLHVHKNIGPLIAAIALMAEQGFAPRLVLCGPYTEQVMGTASRIGVVRGGECPNVLGLGYVTNAEMDALIESAAIVVSSSLYEAGNGPGLEGWAKGRPVAMSDIPSFVEHMRVFGVHAECFDPRAPESIASALCTILRDPEKALALAGQSRERIGAYTWKHAADQYLDLFDQLVKDSAL